MKVLEIPFVYLNKHLLCARHYAKLWEGRHQDKEDVDPILKVGDSLMNIIPSQVTLVVSEEGESARLHAEYRLHGEMSQAIPRDISLLAAVSCLLFQVTNIKTHSVVALGGVFPWKMGIVKSLDPCLQGDR